MKISEMEKMSMKDLEDKIEGIIRERARKISEVFEFAKKRLNWMPHVDKNAEINYDLVKEFQILDMYETNKVLTPHEYALKLKQWKMNALDMFSEKVRWVGDGGQLVSMHECPMSFLRMVSAIQNEVNETDGWRRETSNDNEMITIFGKKTFKMVKGVLEYETNDTKRVIDGMDMEELAMVADSTDKGMLQRMIWFKASKILKDRPVLELNYYLIKKEIDKYGKQGNKRL